MTWRAMLVCSLAAALLVAAAPAEHTRTWRQSDYSEFERGTANGVALRSDGKLVAAPRLEPFADPDLAYLRALKMDAHGRVYGAGGSNARVVRFDESGKITKVFESQELETQALAFDARDNVYAGTSPDGKVYKITPEGKSSVFFEPKTKYIWALVMDGDGNLFVATGDKGEIFVVGPDGKGAVFYKSEEHHARSLALDAKGRLLVGTEPSGLIERVEIIRKGGGLPQAGAAFVVYETEKKEVTALLTDVSGNIYAAAVGEKPRSTPAIPLAPLPAEPVGPLPQESRTTPEPPAQIPISLPSFPSATGGSEVYRIASDGSPEVLWKSREDLVYALGFGASGKLLLGTGNHGAVIELDGNDVFVSLVKTASAQVTSFAAGPGGRLYVATANPGKVFELGPGYASEGTFESEAFDARIFSQWGRLTWWGEKGGAKEPVAFYVRSGNTSNPEKNWSPWAGPYTNSAGETAGCPPARFVQWKAVFPREVTGEPPSVTWVSLAYQPKNVAPVIDGIMLQDPGVRVQGFPAPPTGLASSPPVPLRMPPNAATGAGATPGAENRPRPKTEIPPQGFAQKGYQSVLWSAHDDNDDDLVFSLYYRGEGEKNWKLLKDNLDQRFFSWDAAALPDGAYYLKVVASDSPSNPPEEALTAERESERFEVDNTPPAIENLRVESAKDGLRARFTARDSASAIDRAEYSLDAGEWTIVFPVGRLSDSLEEKYEILLRGPMSAGEHTLAVRVSDRFGNTTSGKVTFTSPVR